ncbi:hypothetical protein DJ017_10700 [Phenylobacterium soli]|uniref:Uncharacterized protein n=1 Tax=Phenylobacterium soli TaxID=2170551 RepID=A0A328AJ41_9CAUL|nr:hypothetical protein DJ017_10700 [Phenylobacterium soli]
MKPQSLHAALDGLHASPHLSAMGKGDDQKRPAPTDREARLAQALRANLRRRKVDSPRADRPAAGQSPHNED